MCSVKFDFQTVRCVEKIENELGPTSQNHQSKLKSMSIDTSDNLRNIRVCLGTSGMFLNGYQNRPMTTVEYFY